MQTSHKNQGFIIRKPNSISKVENPEESSPPRQLSQSQFLKKSRTHRSPGSIMRIRSKEDPGIIRSHVITNRTGINTLAAINYKYQENSHSLRQNDDEIEEVEKEQPAEESTDKIQTEKSIELYTLLKNLNISLVKRQTSIDTLTQAKAYFSFISEHEMASVNNLNIPNHRKKTMKLALINQRLFVLLLCFIEVINGFEQNKNYLINLSTYSIQSLLLRMCLQGYKNDQQLKILLKGESKETISGYSFDHLKNNNDIMQQAIIKLVKIDSLFYENIKKILKNNKTLHVSGQLSLLLEYFAFFLNASGFAYKIPFLAIAPAPYLPLLQFPTYTLIIDIVQVFCSKNKKAVQIYRPFAEYFLDQMSQYYQIISFSDAMPNEANKIINLIDRKKHIKHRLYRYHLNHVNSIEGKDISRLGRDMNRIVLIDTVLHEKAKKNTIVLNPWKGKKHDAELAELCPLLAMIVLKKMNSIKAIKKIQQKMNQFQRLGLKYINYGLDFHDDDKI